jgi:hypothetical protein
MTEPKKRPKRFNLGADHNTFQLVEFAEADALAQVSRDEVQTKLLAELVDTNKLLRDQNRMLWDLLQATRPTA